MTRTDANQRAYRKTLAEVRKLMARLDRQITSEERRCQKAVCRDDVRDLAHLEICLRDLVAGSGRGW